MAHKILVFSGGCHLCNDTIHLIEIGKCKDCKLEVVNMNDQSANNDDRTKRYGVNSVPTIIIDDKIKVVGTPSFPWFCGEEFYAKLEKEYPLLMNP